MESRRKIIRWLRMLLLPAGFAGWKRKAAHDAWFRRSEMPPGYSLPGQLNTKRKQNNHRIRKLNSSTMESRLRIVRWLSFLLLPAGLVGWLRKLSSETGFRRSYLQHHFKRKNRLKYLKQHILIYKRTMETQLQLMHWLSLLQLSECNRGGPDKLSHFSWFRRP